MSSARGYSTSSEVYSVMKLLSLCGALAFPLLICTVLHKVKFRIQSVIFVSTVAVVFFCAFIRGYAIHPEYLVFFLVSMFALLSASMVGTIIKQDSQILARIIVLTLLGIFCLNVLLGNPFSYRHAADFNNYQGISRISGILFAVSLYFSLNEKKLILILIYIISATVFFVICLSGGGRGELIAAIVCVTPTLLQKRRSLALLPLLFAFVIANFEAFLQMRGILRIIYLLEANSLGVRGTLLLDAFAMLQSDITTLLFGCGINCFQYNLGYEYALYPHNYLLEAVVTFGLIGALPLIYMMVRLTSLWLLAVHREDYLLILIGFFFFVVSMKSGSTLSSFLTTFFLICCTAMGKRIRLMEKL